MVNSFNERHKYNINDIPEFEDVYLDKVLEDCGPANMNFYARVLLKPGMEVHRHQHIGESESYFILSGSGMFDDNGTMVEVKKGDITFTPDGHYHNLINTGNEMLEFMALIIKE